MQKPIPQQEALRKEQKEGNMKLTSGWNYEEELEYPIVNIGREFWLAGLVPIAQNPRLSLFIASGLYSFLSRRPLAQNIEVIFTRRTFMFWIVEFKKLNEGQGLAFIEYKRLLGRYSQQHTTNNIWVTAT